MQTYMYGINDPDTLRLKEYQSSLNANPYNMVGTVTQHDPYTSIQGKLGFGGDWATWAPPQSWVSAPANTITYADNQYGFFPTSEVGQQIMQMQNALPPRPTTFGDPRSGSNTLGNQMISAYEGTPQYKEAQAALGWGQQHGHIGHRGRNTSFLKQAAPFLMAAGPFLSAAGAFGGAAGGASGGLGTAVPSSATLGQSVAPSAMQQAIQAGATQSFAPSTLATTGTLGGAATGAGLLSSLGSESTFPGATLSPEAGLSTTTPGLGLSEGAGSGLGLQPTTGGLGLSATGGGTGLQAPAFGGGTIGGGGAAAATGGGFLGNLGAVGELAKKYGPIVYAGIEYKNVAEASQAYQDQLQRAIESSDPFSPEREQYQRMLEEHLKNPEAFLNSPQVQFGSQAAARQMAAMGYNLSPRQAEAISQASLDRYYQQADLLSQLAGAGISPQVGGMNQAAMQAAQAQLAQRASLGNLARTAIETFFGDNMSQAGRQAIDIGGRSFSLGSLV